MFLRTRIAVALALLTALLISVTAFAKGSFAFITITGPKLRDAVRSTDPALTTDFFAFADFYHDKAKAPASPGAGYEITRFYTRGRGEIAFDRLHYYPEAGFVYYDGIVNGSSEYDGEWYTANPEVKTVFDAALSIQIKSLPAASKPQGIKAIDAARPGMPAPRIPLTIIIAISVGLAGILGLALWLRKPSVR